MNKTKTLSTTGHTVCAGMTAMEPSETAVAKHAITSTGNFKGQLIMRTQLWQSVIRSMLSILGVVIAVLLSMESSAEEMGNYFPLKIGADEDGSASKPFSIETVEDLEVLRIAIEAGFHTEGVFFRQTADIDMADAGPFDGIGVYDSNYTNDIYFAGTYDGAGHKISNIDMTQRNYGGIFNQVIGGTIKNLIVSNITCNTFNTVVNDGEWGCSIIGNAGNGVTLQNLVAEGEFGSAENPCTHNVAGIVVRLCAGEGGTLVKDCTNNASLYGTYTKMSGICVLTQRRIDGTYVTFDGCVNNGTLTMPSGDRAGIDGLAGIVAFVQDATHLRDCANYGSMYSALDSARVGELIGWHYSYDLVDGGGNEFFADKNMIGGDYSPAYVYGFADVVVTNGRAKTVKPLGVDSIAFRQRYPWNGLVDIDCVVTCDNPDAEVPIHVSANDRMTGRPLTVESIWLENDATHTNALVVKNGLCRLVWNAGADNPNFVSDFVMLEGSGTISNRTAISSMGRLDLRTGTLLANGAEKLTYSPRWGNAATCTLSECLGSSEPHVLITHNEEEGEYEWTPSGTGLHTLAHVAGNIKYTAQFTVLGDDVATHVGNVTSNETWGAGRVHLVTGTVKVQRGGNLTIESGTIVKFLTGGTLIIEDGGACAATGVVFTHVDDDTIGGDTLGDGDEMRPQHGAYAIVGKIQDDDNTHYRYIDRIALRVEDVSFRQRYPWNGLVDIDFTVKCGEPTNVNIFVSAKNETTGKTLMVRNVWLESDMAHTNALVVQRGTHRLVWDAGTDNPDFVSDAVSLSVGACVGERPLYMVIDLSGGKGSQSYPLSYLDREPQGGWTDEYKTTKLVLRRINPGTFTMGCETTEVGYSGNEAVPHEVTITQPFYIGVFEVTQRQWELVMGNSPSHYEGAMRPVDYVFHNEIRGVSSDPQWPLSNDIDETSFMGRLRTHARGFLWDLPTEAQWEYACRAGTTNALNSGKNLTSAGSDANMAEVGRYSYNQSDGLGGYSSKHTTVGSYLPNAWGLYDMHGNVWEWTLDWWQNRGEFTSAHLMDPVGPASGDGRVRRGGSWYLGAGYCHSWSRTSSNVVAVDYDLGFRLATMTSGFISAQSGVFRLDLQGGTRLSIGASETITYSPRWGGAETCTITVDGEAVKTSMDEGVFEWVPNDVGVHTFTHKAGDVEYSAQFTVLGDDVATHAEILSTNEIWTADKVHLVTATVTVPSGVSLLIEPGAVVKFMPGTSLVVGNGGTCTAIGVVFTHANDDTMQGDTLFDGDTEPVQDDYRITNVIDDDTTEYRYMAPQELTSSITSNIRLRGHRVYVVSNDVTVASGATLTIQPGAILKFASGRSLTVNSGGTLNAQGTRAAPVVFTSIKDDSVGGDTNGDGGSTKPQAGDWAKIRIAGGNADFDNAKILFSSKDSTTGAINMGGGKVVFSNGEIAHSLYDAVGVESGNFFMTNSVIHDCLLAFRHWARDPIVNCIIYDCGRLTQGGGQHFVNCVFSHITETWEAFGFPQNGTTYRNCVFWNEWGSVLTAEGTQDAMTVCGKDGNIWGNPHFLDPANGDFRIAADSPCVDAGDGAAAPEKDYYSQPRQTIQGVEPTGTPHANGAYADIGIYEVQPRIVKSDVDLEVKLVTVPETLTVGELVTVSWREANIGSVEAVGPWYDKVELVSANGAVVQLGMVPVTGIVAGGEKTITESSFRVPAVAEGMCAIRVTANYNRDIYEGSLTANNACLSGETTVSVAGIDFTDGNVARVKLIPGQQVSYSLEGLPVNGSALLIHSAFGETFGAYVSFGKMPTTYASASSFVVLPNGDVLVSVPPHSGDETAYLMLDSTSKIQNGVLDVTVSEAYPAIYALSKESMPNTGSQSLTIYGVGLDEVASVALVATDGTTIAGTSVRVANFCELSASFALTGAKTGAYRVVVTAKDGTTAESTKVVSAYPSESGKPDFRVTVDAPETIRSSRWYEMIVTVANIGNADGASPIISVNGQNLTFKDPDGSQAEYESVIHLVGISQQGDPLVIGAGEVVQIPVMFKQSATASSGGMVVANAISREDVHWGVFIGKGNMSDDEWNAFSAAYKEGFADAEAFLDAVYAKAALVASVGKPPVNAQRLYDFVQREKRGEGLGVVAGIVLDADGALKPGLQFTIGALGSVSPCVGATVDSYGAFVQYAVPTGTIATVSDAGIITPECNYELGKAPLGDCVFVWHDGNDAEPEVAAAKTSGRINRLVSLPVLTPAWMWMDNAALKAGIPQSSSETVILDGDSVGIYRVCPISGNECLLAMTIPVDGTNTLVACRICVPGVGEQIQVGDAITLDSDIYAFSDLTVGTNDSFAVVYSRASVETGLKTYHRKDFTLSDVPQLETEKKRSAKMLHGRTSLLSSSIDYSEDIFPSVTICGFDLPIKIGAWPELSKDTGLRETGCCIWQRETSEKLVGGFSIDGKAFKNKAGKPGPTPGLYLSGKTETQDTYWCQKRKFGFGDCSEAKMSQHSSSYKLSGKAAVSVEWGLGQCFPEWANFNGGIDGRFGLELSASAKGKVTFVRELTKGFVTWPSHGEIVTRDIDRNTYGIEGRFTVSGEAKYSGELHQTMEGPGFQMRTGNYVGSEVPLNASISGSLWIEYHHDWDKTGGMSYHSNTASYGGDIEVMPFFSISGSKQWRNGKVSGGWKWQWRLNPFGEWKENNRYGDTTMIPWDPIVDNGKNRMSSKRLLSSSMSATELHNLVSDIRIDDKHRLSVSEAIPCDLGIYGDMIVCRDYEWNGQKWQGAFVYSGGNAAGRLNEDGENVSAVKVHSHDDGTVRVFYLASKPVLDEKDEDASFKSCIVRTLYCRTLKNGVWGRRECISGASNVSVGNFSLSKSSFGDAVAVIWNEDEVVADSSRLCCSMFASSDGDSRTNFYNILNLGQDSVSSASVRMVDGSPVVDYAKRCSDGADELHTLVYDSASQHWVDNVVIGVRSENACGTSSLLSTSVVQDETKPDATSGKRLAAAPMMKSSGWVVTDDCDRGCNCGCGEYRQEPPPGCICKTSCKQCRQDCGSYCYCGYKKPFKRVTSYDPNEMVGPTGVGEERYVKPGEPMDYTIYFENQTNATAAAQDVYVTLPKDAGLDWSTFRLGEVVFGTNNIDTALSGKYDGESSYALPGTNWSVRTVVTHTADAVKWHLRIIDPTTSNNYPDDAYAGFLPPNDETGRGEGHLRFSVNVKEDAVPGSVIKASAVIEFDPLNGNAPIATDPAWFNTVATIYEPSLDLGDGTTTNLTLIVGQPYGELPVPAPREGWTFRGWFTGPDGTGRQVTAESIVEEGDTTLYAYWTQDVVPLPVFRFYSKAYKGHFFTISEEEKQNLIDTNPNWKFEGTAYRAYTNEASGTVALYRFYSKGYRGHFFTVNEEEAETIRRTNAKNWKYEGIAYYVYPNEVEGSVPVFRFWSKGYRHHFYTTSVEEKDGLIAGNPNWKYEGEAFWALPEEEARTATKAAAKAVAMSNDRNDGNDEVNDGKNDGNDNNDRNDGNNDVKNDKNDGNDANADVEVLSSVSPKVGGRVGPWALATWPDCEPVATDGVTEVGGLVVETRADAPDAQELDAARGEAFGSALPLLLSLPDGAWRATLRSALDGQVSDDAATGVLGFTLPANGVWHWLRVRDAESEAAAFSLWLKVK